ncbi:MAG: hypothetical protein J7M14_02775 [Planctomycetes bacterium]|nr:hypothetical protein [Planctomycetota bacterium]
MTPSPSVAEWKKFLSDPSGSFLDRLREVYGSEEMVRRRMALWLEAMDGFAEAFSPEAHVFIARSCGRVNLLGMHIDHRGGAVNALGVGDMIFVVEARDDDRVVLRNADEQFPPREFSIREELPHCPIDDWDEWTMQRYNERVAAGTQADWSNYVRAGVLYLQHLNMAPDGTFRPAMKGMNVFVNGKVRARAGLSSSSSIVMASMEAAVRLNDLDMSDMELVEAARLAEWFVGTRGGGGDHAAIQFARRGYLAHLGAFPLTVKHVPFPQGFCALMCDSMTASAKTAGARNIFNERVACYELGMLLLRKHFPAHAPKMEHLRDVNAERLGVDEGEIYQMLKVLPEAACREEISATLTDKRDQLERIFRSHDPVDKGYRIRQVCLYGIAECLRSEHAVELLGAGDIEGFGELIRISHDGDRITRLAGGRRVSLDKPLDNASLDQLTADVRSSDPERREAARLYRRPGGYDVSCPQLDEMVDIAMAVDGVLGAGLVGAGLGGCIVVLTATDRAEAVTTALTEQYYQPRGLETTVQMCPGVGGSAIFDNID